AQSVDLCSVSACFPHVITYPEPAFGGTAETGSVSCPASPSASNPCTLTITVKVADVGGPTGSNLLEEVGGYAFASAHQQGALTNAQAEPSIRTDRFGRAFVIGPTGVPAGCKAWRVTHDGSSATYIGQPDHTAGGGDCDWAIGPQETSATILPAPTDDDLAYSSLSLANITTCKSDAGGNSFVPPNVYSQQVGGD